MNFEVAIIGAGVVGCAMARRFTLDGARVVVLERAGDVLDGASRGNSAILHTGFDAPPGSLEQVCVSRGYREYLEISGELGLPVLKSGAMVLAWSREQQEKLPDLIEKAGKNGVQDASMLTRQEILSREPQLSDQVVAGFLVPGECLVDPWTSAHAYLLQAMANGAELRRHTEVYGGKFEGEVWRLEAGDDEIRANHVINCAGLYGDVVDERLTGERRFTVTPRKGQFVVYDKTAAELVSAIILPVPTDKTKGVVVCRTIFGNLLVGPTAQDQESRVDASTDADTLLQLCDRGIEMIPALAGHEIITAYAGLRPATEHQDYQIRHFADRRYVSVGGIRSTGLSAALGIARHVAELVGEQGYSSRAIGSPLVQVPERLSEYHPRVWQEAGNGGIVCHCERVTRKEIEAVFAGPLPPATLQGLKRRTRVCMGRCQGFYCMAEVAKIADEHLEIPIGLEKGEYR